MQGFLEKLDAELDAVAQFINHATGRAICLIY